jgi:hypothetical protein
MPLPKCKCVVFTLLSLAAIITLTAPFVSVYAAVNYGDTNIELATTNLLDNYVDALNKITVTQPTTITSISMYLQYTGSDGSQCIKFGIYGDNGGSYGQSSPLYQPLVATTSQGYCLQVGDFGPAWETWTLLPSDEMVVSPGTYWLTTLAKQDFGTIYHYTYTGAFGGQSFYNYGYFNYAFPASYALGFPPTVFGNTTYGNYLIVPHNPNDTGAYNAPYSFYVTGVFTPAHPIPELFSPQLLTASVLALPLLLTSWRRRRLHANKKAIHER